jgi:hypothetical protein
MFRKITISIILMLILLFSITCKKDYDIPSGNNKVELAAITSDSISYFTVKIKSRLNSTGGNTITDHGLCWSLEPNPTISNEHKSNGYIAAPADISATLSSLQPGKKYFIRSYATIPTGTVYGAQNEFITLKTGVPVSVTDTIADITYSTALYKGVVVADSGLMVTLRGFCWSKTPEPTISGNFDTIGKGLGSYEIKVDALTPSTLYYVRAFAVNDSGTSYGVEKSFTTVALTTPTLTTSEVTNITTTTANSGGNITSDGGSPVTARGVCWGTNPNPTLTDNYSNDGTGTGIFTSNLSGLSPNTIYYVRAYATNAVGTSYGESVSFPTNPIVLPILTTAEINNITINTAGSGGDITSDGGAAITARGVCWSVNPNPTIDNNKTTDGTGSGIFTSNMAGLINNTTYYVRAYATNSAGTAYGNELNFKTVAEVTIPTVTTAIVTEVTSNSSVSGGNVSSTGGAAVFVRGVCYSTTQNPTIDDDHTTDGSGTGVFISNLTGLAPTTDYYVRAYATNSVGTAYGEERTFKTSAITIPTVTTAEISAITPNSATSGGNVTASGGATVTARGVCWSTTENPLATGSHTTDGSGTGSFISNLTGLNPTTTYFVRAYATNSIGTAYGNQLSFTTTNSTTVPTVTTAAVTALTATTATSGGNVTNSGGATVTVRGVCWSTTQNPTTANANTNDGGGTGSYVSYLTGLNPSTTYYVRAYATNSVGTAYGNQLSFTTTPSITIPTVTTSAISNITATSATSGGSVTAEGGATVTARGVCWSTSQSPTLANEYTTDGSGLGSFVSNLTGLNAGTTYYVRAYATNSVGTAYGNQQSFPTLPSGIPCNSFTLTHNAGSVAPVTKTVTYGVVATSLSGAEKCWITQNLGADHQATSATDATEASAGWYWQFNRYQGYKHDGSIRTPNTTWIYPIDENSDWTIEKDPCRLLLGNGWRIPTNLEWTNADANGGWSNYNQTFSSVLKIHAAGSLLSPGGSLVDRGGGGDYFSCTQATNYNCYALYFNIDFSYVEIGGSNKPHGFSIRCLSDGNGTGPSLPTLVTASVSGITQNSCVSGGEVINDGGATVTARGVCWSTNQNPTTSDAVTTDGSGIGSFISNINGLTPGTTYYVRAYATNSVGTAYGNEISFTTAPFTPAIGDTYGGGIIFYIDGTGQHGLISATNDIDGATWGCYGTSIPGTSSQIGTGQSNTIAIVNGCSQAGIAARLCNDLVLNGYDDWFLPSISELIQMYLQKDIIGNFAISYYWSSTEYVSSSAWTQNFAMGAQYHHLKDYFTNVRPIRAF